MKKLQSYNITLLFFLSFCISPFISFGSHGAGGEIYYTWVSDSTYTFYYRFYRDCTGQSEAISFDLCAYNPCNNSKYTFALSKMNTPGNGTPVIPCNSDTKCTNPSSLVTGCEEWLYSGTYSLPSQCDSWRFMVEVSSRNPNNNIFGGQMVSIAYFNNVSGFKTNSSPYFNSKAIYYICANQPVSINNDAIDRDGDSLVTEVIYPIAQGFCIPPTTTNISFVTANPPYNISNNPVQTNNTFILNASTGQMQFTPSLIGSSSMAIRVSEYRNEILLGSTMRDIQFQITPCNYPLPKISLLSPSGVNSDTVTGCVGMPISFCISGSSGYSFSKIKIFDDASSSLLGSTVNYSNTLTDSTTACYSWTSSSTGYYTLNITAVDSICPPNLPIQATKKLILQIGKIPSITISASPDTNIVTDTFVTFNAITRNCIKCNFQWKKNGLDVSGTTNSSWATNQIADMDKITCQLHCNDNCWLFSDTLSNLLTMHVSPSMFYNGNFDSISLYPNPNNGDFTLSGFSQASTDIQIQIVNILGQVTLDRHFTVEKGAFTQDIHTSNHASGQYLVRVKTTKATHVFKMTVRK